MGRPRKVNYSLKEKIAKWQMVGLQKPEIPAEKDGFVWDDLPSRLKAFLGLIGDPNQKKTNMVYLVMYDIEHNQIRTHIAKYLLSKGCIRIQKSVYVANTHQKVFKEINDTLREIQNAYDNHDSILLVPIQTSTVSSMKIIGKNINLQTIVDPPNTLFY